MSNLDNKKNILIFLTGGFPFGKGETFIENEIEELAFRFDEIIILAHDVNSMDRRPVPKNVFIERINYEPNAILKIFSFFKVLAKHFWIELYRIKFIYKKSLSIGILKTMLISLQNAKRLSKKYNHYFSNNKDHNVFMYSYWCNDSALALAFLKRSNNEVKTLTRLHRWDLYFEESKYHYLPYRKLICDGLDAIFSISDDGIDYISGTWKVAKSSKIRLSRLGILNDRQPIDSINNHFKLVSCSNLIPVKRLDLIVESLKFLQSSSWVWFVIGDGPQREYIEENMSLLPHSCSVKMMGRMPNKKIYEFYEKEKPDLFINLSSSEGVPVSIMEAMSFGIPVIATDVGGTREIVNNKNGILLGANPLPREVAQKMDDFISLNQNDKRTKRREAFETWKENYSAKSNYNEFIDQIFSL
jgi:glycosyltransferase involved in cell wall biosynthesis